MNRKIIAEIIALLYVCLMLYTAIEKLSDYDMTREQMGMMPFLQPVAHIIAWLLPVIEIGIAILLFIPRFRMGGLYVVTGLMLFFTIYICYMMIYYEDLPCSCGGVLQELTWQAHIVFNSVFILLGIIAILILKVKRFNKARPSLIVQHN